VNADDRVKYLQSDLRRFWSFVEPEPNSGCWLWTGSDSFGYGYFSVGHKRCRAHRVSYEMFRGPIPAGLQLDHLCRVRCCVNPSHLRACTQRENTLAPGSLARSKAYAEATHCLRGHPLVPENLRATKHRQCKTCHRERNAERRRINPEPYRAASRRSHAKRRAAMRCQ
jgi:hypothetical protein